jgi:glucokinase
MKNKYYIGIDVGGTKVLGCLIKFGKNGFKIIHQDKFLVAGLSKKELAASLHNVVKELMSHAVGGKVLGIGVGLPGQIDFRKNVLLRAPNLGALNGFNFKKDLEAKFRIPVLIENDSRCFALAEALFGAGRGNKNVMGMIVGTGIGSGLVVDGNIYRGFHGSAGEIGHMIVERGEIFGNIASGKGMLRYGINDPRSVEDRARAGSAKAKAFYRFIGRDLGVGISNVINALDPGVIVLGGGISHAYDLMKKDIVAQVKKLAISPLAKKTKIVQSVLGREAGAIGAAALFLESRS